MSLRTVHLLFIALSVLLAAYLAAWAIGRYRVDGQLEYAVAGGVSLAAAAGLAAYGVAFSRRTPHW